MPRAKLRTAALRDHMLRVAVDLIAADGVAAFTTRRLARHADTSTPAVYELFGDKEGLVREVFFEGWRMLRRRFEEVPPTDDPFADLVRLAGAYRGFIRENPVLAELMLLRPVADFDPAPVEAAASGSVREFVVGRVRRAVDAGVLAGDPTDNAHVLVALVQGLAAAEGTGRLGTSPSAVDRRWDLAVRSVLAGLSHRGPAADRPPS